MTKERQSPSVQAAIRSNAKRAARTGTLVLVTHGIEGGPGSAADHAAAIAKLGRFEEVRVGCIKGTPDLAAAIRDAPPPVCVVPMLMARGFIFDLMRRRLDDLPNAGRLVLAEPVGAHPGLTGLIRRLADAACDARGWRRDRTALLLLGHGTPRHGGSAEATREQVRRLEDAGYAAVADAYLEEAPFPAEAAAGLPGEQLVAVGLFLDNGPHGDADARAALAGIARPVGYTGALGADPALLPLILDQAERALAPAPTV